MITRPALSHHTRWNCKLGLEQGRRKKAFLRVLFGDLFCQNQMVDSGVWNSENKKEREPKMAERETKETNIAHFLGVSFIYVFWRLQRGCSRNATWI